MTLEEMEAVGRKAALIRSKKEALAKARKVLERVKHYGKPKNVWRPSLILEKGGGYNNDIAVEVPIPFGVVQQAALNEVYRARRELIAAGGLDD